MAARGASGSSQASQLCWGPARFLAQEEPRLTAGSSAWILFDPQQPWMACGDPEAPLAANQPLADGQLRGQVLATGLRASLWRGPA